MRACPAGIVAVIERAERTAAGECHTAHLSPVGLMASVDCMWAGLLPTRCALRLIPFCAHTAADTQGAGCFGKRAHGDIAGCLLPRHRKLCLPVLVRGAPVTFTLTSRFRSDMLCALLTQGLVKLAVSRNLLVGTWPAGYNRLSSLRHLSGSMNNFTVRKAWPVPFS